MSSQVVTASETSSAAGDKLLLTNLQAAERMCAFLYREKVVGGKETRALNAF